MRSCSTRVATRVATPSPSVRVNSEDVEDDDFDVEVCEEDGSADEFPSTTASDCTALTAPSDFSAGLVFFTHAGLALSANTNYVVVIKQRGTGSVRFKSTTNTGEDTSLGLSGWSIKDKFYWKSGSTWMIKSGSNEALRIVVSGYEVGRGHRHRRDAQRPVGERRDAQPGVRRGHDGPTEVAEFGTQH